MLVQVDIQDNIWSEVVRLGLKKKEINKITEEALKRHIIRTQSYRKLLDLEGKVELEGNLDEMRSSRI